MKVASRVLLALGSILIVYALIMDTTVSSGYARVHNLGLQADRQLLLIFGCFLVLVGVILFAVRKLKQTPEQDANELEAQQSAVVTAKESASRTAHQMAATTTKHGARLRSAVKVKLRKALDDHPIGRIMVGGFVAMCTIPVSIALLNWWLLPLLVLLYSLRDRPAFDLMRSMLRFNLWWTLLHAVLLAYSIHTMEAWRFDSITSNGTGGIGLAATVVLPLVCTVINLSALFYLRLRYAPQPENVPRGYS